MVKTSLLSYINVFCARVCVSRGGKFSIFTVAFICEQGIAASFCFSNPPKVNLNIDSSASKFRKKTRKVEGSRNRFSESNPYGRKNVEDERQFVRC